MTATLPIRLSPSRVEAFLSCPARWGYAELPCGTREPDTDATEFGTDVHLVHEHKYTHGTPYDLETRAGWCAAAMAPHLPRVLPPYGAPEHELTYEAEPGLTLVGRLDLTWPYHDRAAAGALTACVTDYKTTGSMRYAKLERDALFGHSQASLYTLMSMRHYGTDRARARWVYATRPPMVRPADGWQPCGVEVSDHVITRDEATERVHLRMVPPAKEMLAYVAAGLTAADAGALPKNLGHCRAYGRLCPRYAVCQPERDQHRTNAFLLSLTDQPTTPKDDTMAEPNAFLAGLGLPPAGVTTATETARTDGAAPNTPNTPKTADAPAVNPPEVAGKKGKGRAAATGKIDPADIDAIAEAVADKLALRLARNIP